MYNTCFGCGEDNPSGLQMKREYEADGSVVSRIAIEEKYAGDKGVGR
jgi:hypothetical protein